MYKRGFKAWAEKTALNIRKRQGHQAYSPLDMWVLAELHGIRIWLPEDINGVSKECCKTLTEDDPDSWSAMTIRSNDLAVIVLNPTHSKARQASNLAHELSHLILGHEGGKNYVIDGLLYASYNQDEEDEAGWLSGCLLLPREACIYIKKQKLTDVQATRKYGISKEMLNYRMNVTGVAKDFQ
ncbi:MAG: ImmA/IrrE family metallo-endopeptidase [Candidatus Nomurabacteria bacterium]|nr:MAG: ImmA/IrrE family metallo-endopeptidase [Candidatus Nomurabacteria bacterium]